LRSGQCKYSRGGGIWTPYLITVISDKSEEIIFFFRTDLMGDSMQEPW